MKKILLLGGSAQQIIAIETAKRLGYYTVLCDYLPDNPGQYVADKFYLVSTTDKEKVLEVAQTEKIDGIVAYASDPAAPTAAYVAEVMKLPGVPHDIANSFCNKHLFRKFLSENGFNVPNSVKIDDGADFHKIANLHFPIVIKPTDSSGSKGVSVIQSLTQFDSAIVCARKYSRSGIIIAEEYIECDHEDVLEAEIFVTNGEVVVWGILSCVRDNSVNPLVPAGCVYPANISQERIQQIQQEVSRLVKVSRVKNGAFNIEMLIDKDDKLYFIDVGPRNGGNLLPELVGIIANKDILAMTIYAAMGETERLQEMSFVEPQNGFFGLHVIHSNKSGIFRGVKYFNFAKSCLLRECLTKSLGDEICAFQNAGDAVGVAIFKFNSEKDRDEVVRDFTGKHVCVCYQ